MYVYTHTEACLHGLGKARLEKINDRVLFFHQVVVLKAFPCDCAFSLPSPPHSMVPVLHPRQNLRHLRRDYGMGTFVKTWFCLLLQVVWKIVFLSLSMTCVQRLVFIPCYQAWACDLAGEWNVRKYMGASRTEQSEERSLTHSNWK